MEQIQKHGQRSHTKASERYIDITFLYDGGTTWSGSIPIEDRRTGIDLSDGSEIDRYLKQVYPYCHPSQREKWIGEQEEFWRKKPRATVTKQFFYSLTHFDWTCVRCGLPTNPNWARRIQDLKDSGYTLATNTHKFCQECQQSTTHVLLVPLPRGGISGYETWSPKLRERIIKILGSYDAYEGKVGNKNSLLPDHKFPEIRWESTTTRKSLETLTDGDIRRDFQLMSNQRNLQKREVCRACYQSNIRGFPFGIQFYYQGDRSWPSDVPKRGKEAEEGCLGCGWYDLENWRKSLNELIQN